MTPPVGTGIPVAVGFLRRAAAPGECFGCDQPYAEGDRISVTDPGMLYEGRFHVSCDPAQRDAQLEAGLPDPWWKA